MIDTHCHIDMYPNPLQVAAEAERLGVITIGMTNLPSHFELGYKHVEEFRNVRLALGMHPLYSESHSKEWPTFIKNLANTSYIGEIGLDFSKEGLPTKEIQLRTFRQILSELSGKPKILSIHSRKAENEVLSLLIQYRIKAAIFHWYTGPLTLIQPIINAGYYFSINPAMIQSKSGQEIINRIPIRNILAESDGPFIEVKGIPAKPKDVTLVYDYLAKTKQLSSISVAREIKSNFRKLIAALSVNND